MTLLPVQHHGAYYNNVLSFLLLYHYSIIEACAVDKLWCTVRQLYFVYDLWIRCRVEALPVLILLTLLHFACHCTVVAGRLGIGNRKRRSLKIVVRNLFAQA